MPRIPPVQIAGHAYRFINHGNGGAAVFHQPTPWAWSPHWGDAVAPQTRNKAACLFFDFMCEAKQCSVFFWYGTGNYSGSVIFIEAVEGPPAIT
jgi:hypothetical protein